MCSEKSGSRRPLFLTLERRIIPALIEVVRRSRRLSPLGLWMAGNRPLLLAVAISAAQETDLGRDHLDGGARVAVFVFVLADLEAAFYIHSVSTGQILGACLPNPVERSHSQPGGSFLRLAVAVLPEIGRAHWRLDHLWPSLAQNIQAW